MQSHAYSHTRACIHTHTHTLSLSLIHTQVEKGAGHFERRLLAWHNGNYVADTTIDLVEGWNQFVLFKSTTKSGSYLKVRVQLSALRVPQVLLYYATD